MSGNEKTGYFGKRDTNIHVNPKGLLLETTDKSTASIAEEGQRVHGTTREITTKLPNGDFLVAVYDDSGNLVKKKKQKIG